jgi:hypothetical protein
LKLTDFGLSEVGVYGNDWLLSVNDNETKRESLRREPSIIFPEEKSGAMKRESLYSEKPISQPTSPNVNSEEKDEEIFGTPDYLAPVRHICVKYFIGIIVRDRSQLQC